MHIDDSVEDLRGNLKGWGPAVLLSFTYFNFLRFLPYFVQRKIRTTLSLTRGLWDNALVAWLYHVKIVGAFCRRKSILQLENLKWLASELLGVAERDSTDMYRST